jgi:hypothetical protein
MKLQLKERYLDTLSELGRDENTIILPKDITNYDALIEGLSLKDLD